MRVTVLDNAADVARALASRVADALHEQPRIVLGLPTGETPVQGYAELRQLCAQGRIDFSNAATFNLDEFAGIDPMHPGSFRQFMARHLFSGVDLSPSRINFLNGTAADLDAECRRYDELIENSGGIDLQILGIGANGHIGFNEPGETLTARTHCVRLLESTRRDNAALFGGNLEQVPVEALTMGVGSILKAERIVLMATGERKAECVERAVNGPVTTWLPASLLQLHGNVELLIDAAAASRLSKVA
jgi:glucosamine-6-phosphate deaminase